MKIHNAAPVMNNNVVDKNNAPAFKGKGQGLKKYVINDLLKLDRNNMGTMTRDLFVLNAFVFLLGSRIVTSRDSDEKREIAVRDIPTIVIAILGVPWIEKMAARMIQDKSKFAIFKDPGKSPKALMGYNELEEVYVCNKNLSSGFAGFSDRLGNLGGNLNKIYSSLGGNIKDQLKGFSKDNKEFMKQLTDKKELFETVKQAMSNSKNAAFKQASFLKTSSKMIGFGATLALVGLFIPSFNIFLTETIHKNKQKNEKAKTEKASV